MMSMKRTRGIMMASIEMRNRLKGLYFILNTGTGGFHEIPHWFEGIIANGARIIQVRGKEVHPIKLTAITSEVVKIANKYKAVVIVNDLPDVAVESGAHGVHLGAKDKSIADAKTRLGKNGIVGATVRSVKQASKAIDAGADYIACGSVFRSSTKPSVKVVGMDTLTAVKKAFPDFPVCAIGGITLENIGDVLSADVDMAAVISGIASHSNPEKAAMAFTTAFDMQKFKHDRSMEPAEFEYDDFND